MITKREEPGKYAMLQDGEVVALVYRMDLGHPVWVVIDHHGDIVHRSATKGNAERWAQANLHPDED